MNKIPPKKIIQEFARKFFFNHICIKGFLMNDYPGFPV